MIKQTSTFFRPAGLLAAASLLLSACAVGPINAGESAHPARGEQLKAFPSSIPGHDRYVIELPARKHENLHQVELLGGKMLMVDCNVHGIDGQFVEHVIDGWGYSYWQLDSQGQVRSTLMACPSDDKTEVFVQAQPKLLRYNSQLPVVVFLPEGMQLKYRLWSAGTMQNAMPR